MQLSKLAEAFENQFFTSIEQIEALDSTMSTRKTSMVSMTVKDDGSKLGPLDAKGSPRRVFENMTIYKQYMEYHQLKSSLYDSLNGVNRLSKVVMVIGVAYLLFLTVSCFIGQIRQPLAVMLSHGLVFRGDIISPSL